MLLFLILLCSVQIGAMGMEPQDPLVLHKVGFKAPAAPKKRTWGKKDMPMQSGKRIKSDKDYKTEHQESDFFLKNQSSLTSIAHALYRIDESEHAARLMRARSLLDVLSIYRKVRTTIERYEDNSCHALMNYKSMLDYRVQAGPAQAVSSNVINGVDCDKWMAETRVTAEPLLQELFATEPLLQEVVQHEPVVPIVDEPRADQAYLNGLWISQNIAAERAYRAHKQRRDDEALALVGSEALLAPLFEQFKRGASALQGVQPQSSSQPSQN